MKGLLRRFRDRLQFLYWRMNYGKGLAEMIRRGDIEYIQASIFGIVIKYRTRK